MSARSRRGTYLLALNWSLFSGVYAWISLAQGNLLWWLRLDWGSWLSDFAALPSLGQIPAGSVWILWLVFSLVITLPHLSSVRSSETPAITPIEPEIEKPLIANPELMDSRPELKEKILRLHQSLDKI
ncbi:MAG: hypothetical protein RL618_463 [Pseudomonadota bacterium]|jgi:hypothetical protein